jgi:hypothetical protein
MTVLEEGIKAYIEAQVASAGKGYPIEVPVDADFPAWAYETVSDEQVLAHSGATGYYKARMQLSFMDDESAVSSDYALVKAIAAAVRAKLDGYKGTMGSTVYVKYCQSTLNDEWADTHKLPVQRFDVIIHYRL